LQSSVSPVFILLRELERGWCLFHPCIPSQAPKYQRGSDSLGRAKGFGVCKGTAESGWTVLLKEVIATGAEVAVQLSLLVQKLCL